MIGNKIGDLDLIQQITKATWKPELERTSARFHVVVAWVAIVLDPDGIVASITEVIERGESTSSGAR